jgi:hypothetical protein
MLGSLRGLVVKQRQEVALKPQWEDVKASGVAHSFAL